MVQKGEHQVLPDVLDFFLREKNMQNLFGSAARGMSADGCGVVFDLPRRPHWKLKRAAWCLNSSQS